MKKVVITVSLMIAMFTTGARATVTSDTSGIYDENTTAANTVDSSATSSPNDVATFTTDVLAAFNNNLGGVNGFDYFLLPETVLRSVFGINKVKWVDFTFNTTIQSVTSGSFDPISDTRGIMQDGDTYTSLSFTVGDVRDNNTGTLMADDYINQIGFTILSRNNVSHPIDVKVTATYSDASTTVIPATTIDASKGGDDTFFGFTAAEGLSISSILIESFAVGTSTPETTRMGLDDLGFIIVSPSELIAYEGFDYSGTSISNQNGGIGWSGSAWIDSENDFAHLSDDNISLNSSAFMFTPVGDRIEGKGGAARRDLSQPMDLSQDGNVWYFSALLRKNSIGESSGENIELQFYAMYGPYRRFRFGMSSTDQFNVEVGNAGEITGGTVVEDTTYFVVVKLVASASGNDMAYLKAYAPNEKVGSSEPTVWTAVSSGSTGVTLDSMFLVLGSDFTANGAIDEIRIGETWASVAPAPPIEGTMIIIR